MKKASGRPLAPSRTVVRPLLKDDCKAAFAIAKAFSKDAPSVGVLEMHTLADEMGTKVGLAADYGGVLAGVLVATKHKTHMVVHGLWVSAKFRRLGIGSRLMRRACQRIVRSGVSLAVDEANLASHLFLKACGFKATSVVPVANGDGATYTFEIAEPDDFERASCRRIAKYDLREGVCYSDARGYLPVN